jgi:hypothetical protein
MIDKYLLKMKKIKYNYMERQLFFKKISKEIIKNKVCPHCHCVVPTVQKIPKISAKIEVRSSSMYLFY